MPFSVGAQGGAVDIEPFTTIKSFSPLCYWRMDEASGSLVNSGSAASKNATATALTYSATKIATRSPKTAVTFNGTTAFAEVAAGVIGGVNPTFSIGCWINTTTAIANAALICQNDGTNGNSGFLFKINSGAYLSFQGIHTGGLNDFSFLSEQIAPINDGVNHYVSATVRSDTVIIYVDGIEVGNSGGRLGGTWSATPKIFLGQISGGTQRFAGRMSDAFITSQVLTQADHYRIWRNGMLNDVTPPGANFLDAIEVAAPTAETVLTGYDFSDMTIEPPLEPGKATPVVSHTRGIDSGQSVWYKFPATVGGGRRIKVAADGQNPYFAYNYLELFRDTDGTIEGLELISTSLSYLTGAYYITEPNTSYYVRLRQKDMFPAVLDLTYRYDVPPAAPANNNFANAITIDVTSAGSIVGTTDGASVEFPLETDYWDTGLFTSVWYKFTANATGNITLTDTSGNDSIIVLFENVNNIAEVETVVNTTGAYDGDQPALTTAVTSGNTYHVQISDYANGQAFTLAWTVIT